MSENMVERLARAMYDEMEGPVNNADYKRQLAQWVLAERLARAALEAIREPTQQMVADGWKAIDVHKERQGIARLGPGPCGSDVYRAMIDSAIRSGEKG